MWCQADTRQLSVYGLQVTGEVHYQKDELKQIKQKNKQPAPKVLFVLRVSQSQWILEVEGHHGFWRLQAKEGPNLDLQYF